MSGFSNFSTAPAKNQLFLNDLISQPDFSKNQTSQSKPFVLIVGRDGDTRFLFKTAFEIWNYDVAETNELNQAISLSEFKIPDLVLIDGEIDLNHSLQILNSLQKNPAFDNCGFIMISGHAQDDVRQKVLSAGANYFLVKPIDFELLKQFVHEYFKEKNLVISYRKKF
jgi:DNA-binding NtrC family response regulator